MEKEIDEIIAICSLRNEGHTVGISVPCRGCGKTVWLSDSTINSIKANQPEVDLVKTPPVPLCIYCGIKRMEESESKSNETILMPISDEQITELKNGLDKQG
jgi:hypothetical protein